MMKMMIAQREGEILKRDGGDGGERGSVGVSPSTVLLLTWTGTIGIICLSYKPGTVGMELFL